MSALVVLVATAAAVLALGALSTAIAGATALAVLLGALSASQALLAWWLRRTQR